jgi:hypothetical protein
MCEAVHTQFLRDGNTRDMQRWRWDWSQQRSAATTYGIPGKVIAAEPGTKDSRLVCHLGTLLIGGREAWDIIEVVHHG